MRADPSGSTVTLTALQQIAEILYDQAKKLIHSSNVYHNEWAGPCANLLVDLTKEHGGLGLTPASKTADNSSGKVFFANSGTEANEGALKFVRKFAKEKYNDQPAKSDIVCFERAFHGRTLGALSVTPNAKYQDPFAPLLPGIKVGKMNVEEGLEELINENTAGLIVEPIQGEGGLYEAEMQWLGKVVKRAREVGAIVVFDEIQVRLTLLLDVRSPLTLSSLLTSVRPLPDGHDVGPLQVPGRGAA